MSWEVDFLKTKLKNSVDPCPKCGRPLDVMFQDDFIHDALIVRHACHVCELLFNPDGTTTRIVSAIEAEATLELWDAQRRLISEEAKDVVTEAETLLEIEGEING